MSPKRLFVVDAMALAFRCFHAFSNRPITTAAGLPTSAVFGTAQFLLRLIQEQRPDYLVIATDSRHPTFRHELYPQYKANRKEMPAELAAQLPSLFKLFASFGCRLLQQPGFEADDLIGSLVVQHRHPGLHCYIVSGDKDFMQLIDPHTFLYVPQKGGECKVVDHRGVHEKFGCAPAAVIDVLALMGDSSDNVPGVSGIGEKGAAKLIASFGSLAGIYERLADIGNVKLREKLASQRAAADLSRTLVTIRTDIDLGVCLDDLEIDPEAACGSEMLLEFCREFEFTSLVNRLARPTPAAPPPFTLTAQRMSVAVAALPPPVINNHRYTLVDTPEQMHKFMARLESASIFAFDTETTGLDIAADEPIGVSFAVDEGEAFYLPITASHQTQIPRAQCLEALTKILTLGKLKIAHNLKFDLQMLENIGITPQAPFADTMICSYLLDPATKAHGLDACCLAELGYSKIPTSALIGAKGEISMLDVPLGALSNYACEDADYTLRLYHKYYPMLVGAGLERVFLDLEMPLIPILARMEKTGVFIDTTILSEISTQLGSAEGELEDSIYGFAGERFNINSTKQLQYILYDKLKIPEQLGVRSMKKTKSGFSTDVSVLERLATHPLPKAILEFRAVAKLKNTYVDALPQLINNKTERLHTSFHQTGTATGRLSSSQPNLQNIPIRSSMGKEIRRAFRPANADHVIISADYSQVELRLLAHLAADEGLREAFSRGEDIHTRTAAKIFNCAPEAVTTEMRAQAKAVNFGIIYGMGANRLAQQTGVSLAAARDFIEKYFASFPGIKRYIEQAITNARDHGYTETLTGRRRPLAEIYESNPRLRSNAENIAVNTPIQGSAADLIKLAMIKVEKEFEKNGLKSKMLLQVHDELLFECPKDELVAAQAIIRAAMTSALELEVPLSVEIGVGANWFEAH